MLINMLFSDPIVFLVLAAALILSLSIHEFAHAFTSYKLGDPTAKYLGRVTLNPLSHLDIVGTFLLLFAGFGWGKPVPYNPINLSNPKRDSALISFAGPISNFLIAFTTAITLHFFISYGFTNSHLLTFLYSLVSVNLVLGVFNLIPVHPLDGFMVVNGLLPASLSNQWMQMAPYGIFFLIFLVYTGVTSNLVSGATDIGLSFLGLK